MLNLSQALRRSTPTLLKYLVTRTHRLIPITWFVFVVLCGGRAGIAQENIQFTQGSVNNGANMSVNIPLTSYKGRGIDLPISVSFTSSGLWSMDHLAKVSQWGYSQSITEVSYSKYGTSGWRSSLDLPVIEWPKFTDAYSWQGKPSTITSYNGCFGWRVARVFIHMPDGSIHELRKSDTPHSLGYVDTSGTFYAVDGSRLRYDSTDSDTGTLYTPDGTRYVLDAGDGQITDRNGNTLTYDHSTRTWTDTLGRTIANPLPASPSVGTYTHNLPGLSGVNSGVQAYSFKWELLENALTTSTDLQYIGSEYLPYPSSAPTNAGLGNYPITQSTSHGWLFHSEYSYDVANETPAYLKTLVVGKGQAQGALFDPVVLTEITLPDGRKYKFSYNVYGEIDKVTYPSATYETYGYESPEAEQPGATYYDGDVGSDEPYVQTNRRLNHRSMSVDGTGSDVLDWSFASQYKSYTTVTNPDGTKNTSYQAYTTDHSLQKFGYSTTITGIVQSKAFSSSNAILRRALFDYQESSNSQTLSTTCGQTYVSTSYTAFRNPRQTKAVSILFEGSGSALSTTQTFGYDTTYEYSTGVDKTVEYLYDYAVISNTSSSDTAQAGAIGAISAGSFVKSVETSYSSSSTYRSNNVLALPIKVDVKDSGGTIVSESTMSYDDTGYVPSGTTHGLPTTMSTWDSTKGVVSNSANFLTTHATFDSYGNRTVATDAKGNSTTTTYDSIYHTFPVTVTGSVPDSSGTYGSSSAFSSSTSFDAATGLALSTTDINGQTTSYEYNDALLRPTKVTAPNGQQTLMEYGDISGSMYVKVSVELDSTPRWKVAYKYLDNIGRTIRTRQVDSGGDDYALTCYDSMGRVSKVTNPFRSYSTQTCSTTSGVEWTSTSYDDLGRVTSVTTPDTAHVDTGYSLATSGSQIGTMITVTDQTSKLRRSVTNGVGQLIRIDEPTSSGLGTTSSPNQATTYAYDTLNNLTTVTQGSQTRTFVYDSLSRLSSATNPESGTVSYAYDDNANLTGKTDARSITTTYTYDTLNRVTQRSYNDSATPTVNYYYDNLTYGKGRLKKVTNSNSTTEYTSYDILGRVTGQKQTISSHDYTTSYTYDLAGDVLTETYPSGHVVNYNYDTAARLADKDSTHLAFTGNLGDGTSRNYSSGINYDEAGRITVEKLGTDTAVYNKRFYDSRGQLSEIRVSSSYTGPTDTTWDRGAIINHYSWNCWGMCGGSHSTTAMTDNDGDLKKQDVYLPNDDPMTGYTMWTQGYEYDELHRLHLVHEYTGNTSLDWQQEYVYDRYGNRTIHQTNTYGTGINKKDFTVNAGNNRLGVPSGQSGAMSYDNSGNLTVDTYSGAAVSRSYDAENHMTSETQGGSVVAGSYCYDGDGRRVKRTVGGVTIWQVYGLGGELLAEYAASGSASTPQMEYGYRSGQLLVTAAPMSGSTVNVQWLVTDQLGTPRMVFDHTGSLAATKRHDYLPYGEELSTWQRTSAIGYSGDSLRQKFTGYEVDGETGLDFAQARYLNSAAGRFTSTDPLPASASIAGPQTFNRYAYVTNNPLNFTDPTGMMLSDIGVYQTGDSSDAQQREHESLINFQNTINDEYRRNHPQPRPDAPMPASDVPQAPPPIDSSMAGSDAYEVDHPEVSMLRNMTRAQMRLVDDILRSPLGGYVTSIMDIELWHDHNGKPTASRINVTDFEGALAAMKAASGHLGQFINAGQGFEHVDELGEPSSATIVDFRSRIWMKNALDSDSLQVDFGTTQHTIRADRDHYNPAEKPPIGAILHITLEVIPHRLASIFRRAF
jgi:RHS repeat-associated protein